jgi:hypothetical protein
MYHVRIVKTASGSKAVQVVCYQERKRIVLKHIGSCKTKHELDKLLSNAYLWIVEQTKQLNIFSAADYSKASSLEHYELVGNQLSILYEALHTLYSRFGYDAIKAPLLADLVLIRMIEPASKLRSLELIKNYFGITHRRQTFYESAIKWLAAKEKIERLTLQVAEKEFGFDYSLVFYDVTTLYFETFEADELRKHGFSKENKSQQPQILIALIVDKNGFPIAYEVFPGNTFEGHTFIPAILAFVKRHDIKNFTVVADAAMISADNIKALNKEQIHYIVGARLGNLPKEQWQYINQKMIRQDGQLLRLPSPHGFLICSYSSKRYNKDLLEMNKQIEKAKAIIAHPSKKSRTKFVKTQQEQLIFNSALMEKTKQMLGMKGYITDLNEKQLNATTVVKQYHELYKIEHAFRISKNDLKTRPVFHFKAEPIKVHSLICFMALAISRYIELKTENSIREFITQAKSSSTALLQHKKTKQIVKLNTKLNHKLKSYFNKLNLPH